MSQHLNVQRAAVIGAGFSGVAAAIRLRQRDVEVKVFERTRTFGGVWVFDERTAQESVYPSIHPSAGDTPGALLNATYQTAKNGHLSSDQVEHAEVIHAPPGPCYYGLKNNVSMIEMETQTLAWDDSNGEFVLHHRLADYIQRTAAAHDVEQVTSFGTRVTQVWKESGQWHVRSTTLERENGLLTVDEKVETFDAVVVASGHYHAPSIPAIPGLAEWKKARPEQVMHSKSYRRPEPFRDQNVLLVGAGVSSTDIAREIGPYARSIVQVSRGGIYDLPSSMLPANAARVGAIRRFDALRRDSAADLTAQGPIPGTVTLESGESLCDFDRVVICTGYHVSYPFLSHLHADGCAAADADDKVVVTDGQVTHNLHKDIWYIPDPTLAFIGVPYHVATFSLFDFSAVALAAVWSGHSTLPREEKMRQEYRERIARKGAGRSFHSLKGEGNEIAYVQELIKLVADGGDELIMTGHSSRWHEAHARRVLKQRALRSTAREEKDERAARGMVATC